MTYATIAPVEFLKKCQTGEGVELIDVRTPVEFPEVLADITDSSTMGTLLAKMRWNLVSCSGSDSCTA
jgi:hypothetical protein